MLYSEAIRAGAKMRPQAFHRMFYNGGSCANGAAIDGLGLGHLYPHAWTHKTAMAATTGWHWARTLEVQCHLCRERDVAHRLVEHLNDDHRLTREAIADLVAMWESAPASDAVARTDESPDTSTRV